MIAHYATILMDVAEELRDPDIVLGGGNLDLIQEIAASRARSRIHPTESLRAAGVLFDVTLDWLARTMNRDALSDQVFLDVVRFLNASLTRRIRDASAWYASFLLHEVHRDQTYERGRIARELHDRVSYGVLVTRQRLEASRRIFDDDPLAAMEKVAEAQDAIEDAMESIRKLINDLRFSNAVDNLQKALIALLSEMAGEVRHRVIVSGDENRLTCEVRDEVYLIVREALRNALSHSAPTEVAVRIDIAPHELRASIGDDGTGFDPLTVESGAGLAIMEERAKLLGGSVAITSRPRIGTMVELLIPILRESE
ncbi:sensor histidine kinase [Nonomuraea guangzhouensis]|uniref:Sensor histidine kinase n=1 Tax=Nonomuraea guangzhouensis TaxID=1291555 RepID=A0ABW4FYB1_9ACTN|nr:histidine kinase [Nonomuraea guangzhouensis]